MSEQQENLLPTGYDAISETARNLSRTLQAAPAQESRRIAALRQYLILVANALAAAADTCTANGIHSEKHTCACRRLIRLIRAITTELTLVRPAVPPGVEGVLQTFAERLLPDGVITLRASRMYFHSAYSASEYLKRLQSSVAELQLDCGERSNLTPNRFLVLTYPQGEQDNVLQSCTLMRAFFLRSKATTREEFQRLERFYSTFFPKSETTDPFDAQAFATWILGPAYFFAFASEKEAIGRYHHNGSYVRPRLCRILERLESVGWFAHPQMGPLLVSWRERFGIREKEVRAHQQYSAFAAAVSSKVWVERFPEIRPYTPEDFDRDVPRLWERLRQLIPPNDLDIEGVESVQPADTVSILNAGWSFALLHMEDLYRILGSKSAEDRYEAKQVLNRLLTKGIELSRIAQRWKEAREGE